MLWEFVTRNKGWLEVQVYFPISAMATNEHLIDEKGGWLEKSHSIYLKYLSSLQIEWWTINH